MYDLPPDFDFGLFADRYLFAVTFGASNVRLCLDKSSGPGIPESISVLVVGIFDLVIDGEKTHARAEDPSSGTPVVKLLDQCVTVAERVGKGGLRLRFGPQDEILLIVDDTGFEGYTIFVPGEDPYVV